MANSTCFPAVYCHTARSGAGNAAKIMFITLVV